jgi:hypothetical protein
LIAGRKLSRFSRLLFPSPVFSDKNKFQCAISGQKEKPVTVINFDQNFDLEKNECLV